MEKEFPIYLPYKNERIYSVQGYIDSFDSYVVDKCYVERASGRIFLYTNEKTTVPTFFKNENGDLVYTEASLDEIADVFVIDNAYGLSTDSIIESTTGNEVLYNEDAIRDMNAATSTFVPVISAGDDCLKQLVKYSIKGMHVNVHMLKSYMTQKYAISNLKAALVGKTKMTIPNFNLWCELLGLDYEIIVKPRDDGKIRFPKTLQEPLVYNSATDKVTGVHEDEEEEYIEEYDSDIVEIDY